MIGRAIRFQFPENNKDLEMVITIDRHKANLDKIAEYKGIKIGRASWRERV